MNLTSQSEPPFFLYDDKALRALAKTLDAETRKAQSLLFKVTKEIRRRKLALKPTGEQGNADKNG